MTSVADQLLIADGKPKGFAIDGIKLTFDARDLRRIDTMFLLAPDIIGTYMRDVFGQFGGSFRRELLARATPGIRRLARQSIFYQLRPKQGKKRGVARQALTGFKWTAKPSMDNISLRIYSTSKVTLLHEQGGTITPKSGGAMVIPARGSKTRKPGKARYFNQRGKARREALPSASSNKGLVRIGSVLYRVTKESTGRSYQPTHILVRKVTIKPQLGILRTWDSMAADRARRLQKAIDGAAQAMAAQVGKSLNQALTGVIRGVA